MSKFIPITSYSCEVSASQGLTVLRSAVVPSTKSLDPVLDGAADELTLWARAVPASDTARKLPSAATTTTARRPVPITCLPPSVFLAMACPLLPYVLRTSPHAGFVDRQRSGIRVHRGLDPERDGREMLPVTERKFV